MISPRQSLDCRLRPSKHQASAWVGAIAAGAFLDDVKQGLPNFLPIYDSRATRSYAVIPKPFVLMMLSFM